jgi:hypothetical protein
MRRFRVVCLLAVLLVPTAALAQATDPSQKAAAQVLFDEGRKLVTEGNFAEACGKFAESQKLDASPATLLNLGSCWEKAGRTASAWATYREAESSAAATGRQDYSAAARRHAERLEIKLVRLSIKAPDVPEGLTVRRDGILVARAEWGVEVPVDPGAHSVTASAPGFKDWTSTVSLTDDGARAAVVVPALEPMESGPTRAEPPPTPPPSPRTESAERSTPPPSGTSESGSPIRLIGAIVFGAGIAGLGASAVLAVVDKDGYNTSLGNCQPNNPAICNGQGVSQRNDARTAGDAATAAFVIGAAAAVGGGLMWILGPRPATGPRASAYATVAPTLGGVVVGGSF